MGNNMLAKQRELIARGWTLKNVWGQDRDIDMYDDNRGVWLKMRFDVWGHAVTYTKIGTYGSFRYVEVSGMALLTPEQADLLVNQTLERVSHWHELNARRASA